MLGTLADLRAGRVPAATLDVVQRVSSLSTSMKRLFLMLGGKARLIAQCAAHCSAVALQVLSLYAAVDSDGTFTEYPAASNSDTNSLLSYDPRDSTSADNEWCGSLFALLGCVSRICLPADCVALRWAGTRAHSKCQSARCASLRRTSIPTSSK